MASEIIVNTIKAPTTGANANKVIIPSGVTLDASGGNFSPPSGHIIQTSAVTRVNNLQMTINNSSVNTAVETVLLPALLLNKATACLGWFYLTEQMARLVNM